MKILNSKMCFTTIVAGAVTASFFTSAPNYQSMARRDDTPKVEIPGEFCPKCRGVMEIGILVDYYAPGSPSQAVWSQHKMGLSPLAKRPKETRIASHRCTKCGFLEFYAPDVVKP